MAYIFSKPSVLTLSLSQRLQSLVLHTMILVVPQHNEEWAYIAF
nr:MAG TPA: hypothetical protein [Caudoviricetes sp.]